MIDRFKVSYAKMYNKEAEVIASVKIRNAWRNRFRGQEINIVNDEKLQLEQTKRILDESVQFKRNTGTFKSL